MVGQALRLTNPRFLQNLWPLSPFPGLKALGSPLAIITVLPTVDELELESLPAGVRLRDSNEMTMRTKLSPALVLALEVDTSSDCGAFAFFLFQDP